MKTFILTTDIQEEAEGLEFNPSIAQQSRWSGKVNTAGIHQLQEAARTGEHVNIDIGTVINGRRGQTLVSPVARINTVSIGKVEEDGAYVVVLFQMIAP